ncbi:hypothetical protein B0H11DRAFT_1934798 [Mycena galericulata]|nr:hypothetical protein B0H11DRAFT_1934798 [Mycena galericulata]
MAKRKSQRKIIPDPNATYSPKLSAEERAASHRKASAKYYSSARKRINKRRWDPPTQPVECYSASASIFEEGGNSEAWKPHPGSAQRDSSQLEDGPQEIGINNAGISKSTLGSAIVPSYEPSLSLVPSHEPSFWDYRARSNVNLWFPTMGASERGALGTAASPNSDERIASQALAALATDSVLERTNKLTSLGSSVAVPSAPPRPRDTNDLSPAQATLMQIVRRNATPLTPPTEEEAAAWRLRPYVGGGGVDADRHWVIVSWRAAIIKAHRAARIYGYEIRDGVVVGDD